MHEAVGVGGADVARDDRVLIDEDVRVDRPLGIGVIVDGVGVALDRFALVFLQIHALLPLDGVILVENRVEGLGDDDVYYLNGILIDLPAVLRQEGDAVVVGGDIAEADLLPVGGRRGAHIVRIAGQYRDERDEQPNGDDHDGDEF